MSDVPASPPLMFSLDDLEFPLPEVCIAQEPLSERDAARLLVVRRAAGAIEDRTFREFSELLASGDVLVLNDTRVLPARLRAVKPDTGADIDVLLLEERTPNTWDVMVRPGRRVSEGTDLLFDADGLRIPGRVTFAGEGGLRRVEFLYEGSVQALLDAAGAMPLPPYIKRAAPQARDRERYQTVYATQPGAVAAPTAGLHFTQRVFDDLRQRGVEVLTVTLHVGLGTFQPLTAEHVATGRLHEERYTMPEQTAHALNAARQEGRRIVAVGTTAVRVLETVYDAAASEPFVAGDGRTSLFLKPGDPFRAVDAMLTNFHMPRSSLFALVCAFAGPELMRRAYAHAVDAGYRFYSYGDATFLC